ncbi:interleukin-1 receptor type 2 [Ambystoma mexicanum]|uniref:interleukin-1 receptor type 2 n=1 Tax=Ambystoma mexicanum TaxID=8296 RepID=UPI0037E9A030
MLWPLCALIAPWLLHASAFRVQRLENAETCRKSFMHFKSYYIQSGEPAVLKCPPLQYLHLDYAKASRLAFNLTWYKNESRKLLPEDDLRIQVQEGALWFFPTSTEDTGHYHCILRNSSYCLEVIISFSVVRRQDVSLPDISYQQHVFTLASEQIYCPDLSDFTTRYTDWKLKWYKNNIILPNRNTKFKYLEDTTFLQIEDVTEEDEGYFTCEMTFTHTGTQYAITRIIQLQTVEQEKRNRPIIVYPNRKTIAAALGSRLIIPCKVFTGYGRNSMTVVWWLANDSYIDEVFQDGRVKEGQFETTIENDANYVEVQLVFDEVREEDFITDFKCYATNDYGSHVFPTQLRPAESSISWYVAAVPVAAVFLIVSAIAIYRCGRARSQKGYALPSSLMANSISL